MDFRERVIAVSNLRKNWSVLTTKMDEMTALSGNLMIEDACMNSKSKDAKTVVRWYYAVAKKRDEMVVLSQEYNQHTHQHTHSSFFKRCYNFEETMKLSCKVSTFLKHVMELDDQLHSDAAEGIRKFNRNSMETFFSEMERRNPIRFTHAQLQSFTSNFSSRLGSGGFGEVFKGKLPTNSKMIAVKVLKIFNSDNEAMKAQFMAEVGTIYTTHHRNLVKLYGFCFDTNMKAVVYEYMENGSLDKILFDKNQIMDWERLQGIAIGTAKGLSYLHDECHETIIHYDIKPGNILLDSIFCPKIADFGLAKIYNRGKSNVSVRFRGTPGYAAPELWVQSSVATSKCDVYSYGMMLFEIVGRRRNLDPSLSEDQEWLPRLVWEKFEKGELDEFLAQCGFLGRDREKAKKMYKLALCCVQRVHTDRPSMSEVVEILEGDRDAMEPSNPFSHLFTPVVNITSILSSIEGSTTNTESNEAISQHFTPYEMVWDSIQ